LTQQNNHKFVTITVVMSLFSKKQSGGSPRRRQSNASERASSESLDKRYAFRRNRTLTGSASSQVSASTNESKAQLKSERVQTHELVRRRRHIGLTLFLVLLCATGLFGLIWQFTASVKTQAQDASMQLDAAYEKTIQDYLARHPAERLRFLLDTNALSSYVQSVSPEVASVKADGSAGFGRSAFLLTMRRPIAGWSINGNQQYVDSSGTAFTRNYFASPAVQIVDNSGIQVAAGQAIASNRFLGFVGRVVGAVKAQGYVTQQVIIPPGSSRQVELRLEDVAYPIKFSVDRAAGEQVEDMVRGIRWLTVRGQTVEYLDVRVSGKAFYR
jgi:hypothetical protein